MEGGWGTKTIKATIVLRCMAYRKGRGYNRWEKRHAGMPNSLQREKTVTKARRYKSKTGSYGKKVSFSRWGEFRERLEK